jgi:hypothetical protein
MATAPINRPNPIQFPKGTPVGLPQINATSSNAFLSQQFLTLSSGAYTKTLDAAGTSAALSQEDSASTATNPPDALYGNRTSALSIDDVVFVVNITDASGTIGSGSTRQQDVTIGSSYAMVSSTGAYANVQMLNAATSSPAFFKVLGYYPADATSDYNGRVYATFAGVNQQPV